MKSSSVSVPKIGETIAVTYRDYHIMGRYVVKAVTSITT